VNSIQCKSNNLITFYNNGSLESCVLAKSTSAGMIKCRRNGLIYADATTKAKQIVEEATQQALELKKDANRHLSAARQKTKEILAHTEK
jgi:vacuolar-type H+-ATPase subunit E/Vma4